MPSTPRITIGDRESVREDALNVVNATGSADSPDQIEYSVPHHLNGRSVLQFGSYDDRHEHLLPLRLELI